MSELLLRGFNPAKSYLENGADIILSDGTRIEIKCSHKVSRENGYSYNIRCGHAGQKRTVVGCDFIICWCMDDNDFFIIPFADVKDLTSISLPTIKRKSKYSCYRDNWEALRR